MDEGNGSEQGKLKVMVYNEDLEETIDYMQKLAFTEFNKHKTAASSNIVALQGIIMGQCSGSLNQHIKAEEDYESNLDDLVWLLKTLKRVILGVMHQLNINCTTGHTWKDLYKTRQKADKTVEE